MASSEGIKILVEIDDKASESLERITQNLETLQRTARKIRLKRALHCLVPAALGIWSIYWAVFRGNPFIAIWLCLAGILDLGIRFYIRGKEDFTSVKINQQ